MGCLMAERERASRVARPVGRDCRARAAIAAPQGQLYLCNAADPDAVPVLAGSSDTPIQADYSPRMLAEAIARPTAATWRPTPTPPAPLYARAASAAPAPGKLEIAPERAPLGLRVRMTSVGGAENAA